MWFLSPVFMSGRSFVKVKYEENNGEVIKRINVCEPS